MLGDDQLETRNIHLSELQQQIEQPTHRLKVGVANAAATECLAIALFGEVRFAAEGFAAAPHGYVEGFILEGMQRVVVNEDIDRTLGREQVRRVIDGVTEPIEPGGGRILIRSVGVRVEIVHDGSGDSLGRGGSVLVVEPGFASAVPGRGGKPNPGPFPRREGESSHAPLPF